MRLVALVILFFLSGCFLVPHKTDVQQGNYIDQEMVSKLKLNMTRSQVNFVLGTPLIADLFHPDRWDYVFLAGKAGDVDRERVLTLFFSEDKLVRIEGDVVPTQMTAPLQVNADGR